MDSLGFRVALLLLPGNYKLALSMIWTADLQVMTEACQPPLHRQRGSGINKSKKYRFDILHWQMLQNFFLL